MEDVANGWRWDPSLYASAAPYYRVGRLPYPPEIAGVLGRELSLDGTGRLLDVGCGPGSLTLILTDLFSEVVGLDADAAMLAEADREASRRGIQNVTWLCERAELLPAGLGRFDVVTLAQSFHWMDQPRVAGILFQMLHPGGTLVHVGATTHRGKAESAELPGPAPPRKRIDALVVSYLGPVRRAGQGTLPSGTRSDENSVLSAAGFQGPRKLPVGGDRLIARSEDEIVASVFSLSYAAPHHFADRVGAFEADLRDLLRQVSPTGEFWEVTEEIMLSCWKRP